MVTGGAVGNGAGAVEACATMLSLAAAVVSSDSSSDDNSSVDSSSSCSSSSCAHVNWTVRNREAQGPVPSLEYLALLRVGHLTTTGALAVKANFHSVFDCRVCVKKPGRSPYELDCQYG